MEISPKNIEVEEWVKSGEEWRKLFTRTNSLDTNTYAILWRVKSIFERGLLLSCFWVPYMMIACVIYDERLRHIWYLPASYMIPVCVIYDAGSCHIGCRLMPNMPPASTLYADIRKHLSWRCYTLGEWVIFMLPSWRETATISANGGCWSYTLSERLNAKYLIIR